MLTFFLLIIQFLLRQQVVSDNYKIYSVLISSEIIKTTKSVTIIKYFQSDTSYIPFIIDAIKSKDPQQLEQVRLLTRDDKGNIVRSIDTTIQNEILSFYQNHLKDATLENLFSINVKVFLINSLPFKKSSQEEWNEFHKKYVGSGGIFQFSNIYYSKNSKTAIFYYSLLKNSLNAHGALTIMTNINGKWKIKYQINILQA